MISTLTINFAQSFISFIYYHLFHLWFVGVGCSTENKKTNLAIINHVLLMHQVFVRTFYSFYCCVFCVFCVYFSMALIC